jgi:two-component system, NtrC family, sensor histidine kinase PilS
MKNAHFFSLSTFANAAWSLGPLAYSHLYRVIIAVALTAYYFYWNEHGAEDHYDGPLYLKFALAYLLVSFIGTALTRFSRFSQQQHVAVMAIVDIVFIVGLIYASGGLKSGLGLLLVVAIAFASLFSKEMHALFYAAVASIALLLEQAYQWANWDGAYSDFTHAAMLSLSCFATAWLGYSLARRTQVSEDLASKRGVDLENMAYVNALITQEMQDGVLVVDGEMALKHYNIQAEVLLGKGHQLALDKPLAQCAPEVAKILVNRHSASVENVEAVFNIQSEGRELRLRVMPVGDIGHDGAVIFLEDWSQIQVQSQQVKLAALGRLTANIAHEIRNPLSAISHANQLLLEEEAIDPTNKRMLEIISSNVLRLDQIVKDVLELSRRDRTQQQTIELNQFLQEFHHQICQVDKIPKTAFVLSTLPLEIKVPFDERHLNQILWNLCRNGWRHCQQNDGSLKLSVHEKRSSKGIEIEVEDDGPGVEQDMVQHLFEPFFTTVSTGTGLGLYIGQELAEANGASLEYKALKEGCKFIIHIKKVSAE